MVFRVQGLGFRVRNGVSEGFHRGKMEYWRIKWKSKWNMTWKLGFYLPAFAKFWSSRSRVSRLGIGL